MNLNAGARVRQPREAFEHRLGIVADVTYPNPQTTYISSIRLRFPTGEERSYRPEEVVACSRTDDHAALVAAFTDTCRALRTACRIAHDYDERLSGDILSLLLTVFSVAATRLGVCLDPAHLDPPTGSDASIEEDRQ